MRKTHVGMIFAAAATLLVGNGAWAQDGGITVTGKREIKRSEASRFVRQIQSTVDGQFPRFSAPVCPMVLGIPDEYAAIVQARFRDVAQQADIRVAPLSCAPNVIIIVATDADKLVKSMRREVPGLFGGLELSEIRAAMRDGPVHVWSTVATLNEDGQGSSGSGSKGEVAVAPGGPPTAGAPTMLVKSASLINLSTQQVTLQSVMVIDDDAALGKTLTQIADYAAMRTLAGARPPKASMPADTILTLFEPQADVPPTLTLIDRSYLKGLYKTRPNGKGLSQASSIARTINEDSRERSGMR